MKRMKNAAKYSLYILLSVVLMCCNDIPNETLDGKILKDDEGNIVKLEWQTGGGQSWRFLYPTTRIHKGDTTTVWEYYR
jgi:hypothetical protein